MNDNRFKNVLAFCILMGGGAVLSKSPDYIMEKFHRYVGPDVDPRKDNSYLWGLDENNTLLFNLYLDAWVRDGA